MSLVRNWRRVLRYAWSIHLNLLLALASAADSAISYAVDGRISASLLVAAISLSASVLRLIAQRKVSGGGDGE